MNAIHTDKPTFSEHAHPKRPCWREFLSTRTIVFRTTHTHTYFTDLDKFYRLYNSGNEITIEMWTDSIRPTKSGLFYADAHHESVVATVKKYGKNAQPLTDKLVDLITSGTYNADGEIRK